jgi:hypothetical protein
MRFITVSLLPGMIFLIGCAAQMVVNPGSQADSPYSPINEASRPGIIRYLSEGAQPVKEARRNDAYRKMYEACGGKYRILREGSRSEGGVVVPTGSGALYADSQYIYIEFECVKQ